MKILLIDGNNLGMRAFARSPLEYEYQRTEVIYIGLGMIKNYLEQFHPDRCIVIWDGGRDQGRLRIYPDYKKRRKEKLTKVEKDERELFIIQIGKLMSTIQALGITQYQLLAPRREADDVIASMVHRYWHHPIEADKITIVSTDRDFYQLLVFQDVKVFSPVKDKLFDNVAFEKEFKIPCDYYLEYKAMVGDPSDNLPGIKGLGPVSAAWLVNNIIAGHCHKIKKKEMRSIDLLYENLETFALMKELIQFREIDDLELKKGRIEDIPKSVANLQERAMAVLGQYGFDNYLKYFPQFIAPFEKLFLARR